jgi:hypothetical protein
VPLTIKNRKSKRGGNLCNSCILFEASFLSTFFGLDHKIVGTFGVTE